MLKNFQITILTDETSWMNKYNVILAQELQALGHDVKILQSKNELEQGDIAFFLSCFEIVEKHKLKLNKHNLVVHESNLPQGKGWSPMSWQILEGKNIIPVTLFEASEEVDAGDIYNQDEVILKGNELISEWQELLGQKTIEMCISFVQKYNEIKPKKQIGIGSFYPKRTPKDSEVNINKTINEQFNLLRIVDNEKYPAFFEINGCKYKLKIERYE